MQEVKNRNIQYAINLANKKEKTQSVAFKSSILRKVIQHAYQSKEPQIIQKAIQHVQREINEREKNLYYDVLEIVTEGIDQQQQQSNQQNFFSMVKKDVVGKQGVGKEVVGKQVVAGAGPGRMVGIEQAVGHGMLEQSIGPNLVPNNDIGGSWGEVEVFGGVTNGTVGGSTQDDLQRLINLIEQGKIFLSEKNTQIENQNKFILFLIILIKSYWHEIQSQIREINDHHTANQKTIQKIMEEKQALKQLTMSRDGALNINVEIPLSEKYPSSSLVGSESVSVKGTKQISSGRINNMKVEKKETLKIPEYLQQPQKVMNIEVLTKMEPYEPLKINQSTPIRIGPLDDQKKRRQSSSIDIQRTTSIDLPVIQQTRKQSIQLDLAASKTEETVQRTKNFDNFVQQTELPKTGQQKRIQMPQIKQEDQQVKKKNMGSKIEMPIIMEDEDQRVQVVHQRYQDQNSQNQKSNDVPVQPKQNKNKTLEKEKDFNRRPVEKNSAVQIEKTSAAQEIQKSELPHTQQQKQKIQEIIIIKEMPIVMEETSNEEFVEIKQKQQNKNIKSGISKQKQEEVYEQQQDKQENESQKLQIANSERGQSQNSRKSENDKEQNSRQTENLKEQNSSQSEDMKDQNQNKTENSNVQNSKQTDNIEKQNSSQSESVREKNSRQSNTSKQQKSSSSEKMKDQNQTNTNNSNLQNSKQSDNIEKQNSRQSENVQEKNSSQSENITEQNSSQSEKIIEQKSKQSENITEQKSSQSENITEQKSIKSKTVKEQKSRQSENVKEQKSRQSENVKEQKSRQSENVKEQNSNLLKLEFPNANNLSSEQSYYENQLNNSSLDNGNDQIFEDIPKQGSQSQIYEDFIQQNLYVANQFEQPEQIQSQRDLVEFSEGQLLNKQYASVNTDDIRSLPKLGNEFKILYQNASDYYKVKENI